MPAILSVCSTSTEPSGPTASSTRSARCSPSRPPTRSPPSWSPCPTRGMERWLTQRRLGPARRSAPNVELPAAARARRRRDRRRVGGRARGGPVAARADGVAAARGRRRVAGRAVGGDARRAPRRRRPIPSGARAGSAACATSPSLFDRYALHRPELVLAWAAGGVGRATGRRSCGARLRARIGVPGPAERLERGVRAAARRARAARPAAAALAVRPHAPARRPPRVLRALAAGRDVHLFLLHPSPALWARLAGDAARGAPARRPDRDAAPRAACSPPGATTRASSSSCSPRPAGTPTTTIPSRRRRARCSRASRPTCAPTGGPSGAATTAPAARPGRPQRPGPRLPRPRAPGRGAARRDPAPARRGPDARAARRDRACARTSRRSRRSSRRRSARARRSPRRTRTRSAAAPEASPPDLRVRLADRSLRQTNPVLGAVARLLDLADQRLTASQVLDLADREPVRRRFRFDDDDLVRLEDWVAAAGIRWGLDAPHRAPFKLEALPSGTWRAGLDRVLVGVTMTEDEQRLFAGVLPLDDVDSGAIELAGRFAELVDRLEHALDALEPDRSRSTRGRPRSPPPPTRSARPAPRDAWQRAELQRVLDDVVAEATAGGAGAGHAARAARGPRPARRAAAGRPDAGELPHRPPDRSARSSRCARCRTASSACSGSTTPPSRAARRATATTGCSTSPHVGERDAARRGPPDAARRADGGDGPARRSPTRATTSARTSSARPPSPSASCSTSSTAPCAPADGPARDAGRRPPSAAAVRRPQLHAGRARARPAVELRPRHARRRPRARRRARGARPVPRRPAAPAARRRCSRSRTSSASPAIPCARSCASGSGSASPTYDDEVEDALPVELDAARGVGDRPAAARGAARGHATRAPRRSPRSRAAACRRACSAGRWSTA